MVKIGVIAIPIESTQILTLIVGAAAVYHQAHRIPLTAPTTARAVLLLILVTQGEQKNLDICIDVQSLEEMKYFFETKKNMVI